jgi:nucleotide-binding universal stress UspA family protein
MEKPYRAIACCVDRDQMTDAVLGEGVRLADGDLTKLRIVHVVAPPRAVVSGAFAYVTPLWEAVEDGRAWVEGLAAKLPGARPVLLEGPPVRVITEWVQEEGVDLLVAAASRDRLERALLGGFASHLAYHAPCSVLFVHPEVSEDEAPAGATAGAAPPAPGGAR